MKPGKAIIAVAVAVSITGLNPATTHAGEQEWAAAGKILTGIAALNVIGHIAGQADFDDVHRVRHHRRERYAYSGVACKPRFRYHKGHKPITYKWRKHRKKGVKRHGIMKPCDDPVIVKIDDDRRIIQRRVHNAPAYLQVYSEVCDEWVTLREYPSIW